MRRQQAVGVGCAGLFIGLHAARWLPVVVNVSASMPVGVYWKKPSRAVSRGSLVLVCPSGEQARSLLEESPHAVRGSGCGTSLAPIVKRVVAVENDFVAVTAQGVSVNRQPLPDSAPKKYGSSGKALPVSRSGRISEGEVFLLGLSRESLDSRYFGPVLRSDIAATLERVL